MGISRLVAGRAGRASSIVRSPLTRFATLCQILGAIELCSMRYVRMTSSGAVRGIVWESGRYSCQGSQNREKEGIRPHSREVGGMQKGVTKKVRDLRAAMATELDC